MRTRLILLPLVIMASLCSCSNSEIRDRAFVQSMGVDCRNGNYNVSLRIFDSDQCYQGSGSTFEKAVDSAESMQGREFYTGHTELLVLTEKDSRFILENLVNEDISPDCLVIYDTDPVDFVRDNDTEAVTEIINTADRNGTVPKKNICDVINEN